MPSPNPPNNYHRQLANFYKASILLTGCLLSACQFLPISTRDVRQVDLISQPVSPQEQLNLENLEAAKPPSADLSEIYSRFNQGQLPEAPPLQDWQVGDTDRFFYTEQTNETQVEITARVVYQSDELVMWLEEGVRAIDRDIQEAAQTLETKIFPTTRALFGSEPSPGIDQDRAIHILHIGNMGGSTIGYFSGKDEYPRAVAPNSNQREMFYINLNFVDIGEFDYYDVVSHEFQHMIHWNIDRNEHTWVNEGLAELATMANGYGGSDFLPTFLANPDTSLTGFDYEGGDYAAAWLMVAWLQEKYGNDFIFDLVKEQNNSVQGISTLLNDYETEVLFPEIYADWMVAVYGSTHNLKLINKYSFESVAPFMQRAQPIKPVLPRMGQRIQTTVGQYGTDYWQIPADQPYSLTITTTQQVQLLSGDPFAGQWYWTAVPADFSDMHLTHPVDLSSVSSATLNFQAYYDIELGYDYAYVAVSADNGQTWSTISTTASVDSNPHNKNIGNGITGLSGPGEEPSWLNLTADLTPWAGPSDVDLLIRFEYMTDDAVQHEGIAIDNISIPEINWNDDVENGENSWQAAGFVRHTNRLPQTFILQTIAIQQDGTATVTQIEPSDNGRYEIDIVPSDDLKETILAIAGTTPITHQQAGYHLRLDPVSP